MEKLDFQVPKEIHILMIKFMSQRIDQDLETTELLHNLEYMMAISQATQE